MNNCGCSRCSHELCTRKVPIFSTLSEDEMIKIVNMTGHKNYKKGEILCREGEVSDTLYIINEGRVKLSKITKEGKEQIIHILSSGEFFGELNLFSGNEIYNFDAYAISQVKICTLTKDDMHNIILANPEISLKILQEVSKRLAETENLAQNLATNDAEVRVASMILDFAEKYGAHSNYGIKIELPVNREEMANYCGVTRETISRKLAKLEELEIIKLEGTKIVYIVDEETLREYVG